jgi:hypothetical protein
MSFKDLIGENQDIKPLDVEMLAFYSGLGIVRMEHFANILVNTIRLSGKERLIHDEQTRLLFVPSAIMAKFGGVRDYRSHIIEVILNLEGEGVIETDDPTITFANTLVGLEAHIGVVATPQKICEREIELAHLLRQAVGMITIPELPQEKFEEMSNMIVQKMASRAKTICDREKKCKGCPLDENATIKDVYLFFGNVLAMGQEQTIKAREEMMADFDVHHVTMH